MPGRAQRFGLGLLIAIGLIPFYLLTYNGIYRVDDEHILGSRAQSLALWGQLESPQVAGNSRVQSLIPMGDQATQIEPLQSVLGAGLYRLGVATGGGGRQALMTLNLYLTALTALVIFLTITALGIRANAGALTAVLFGLGSMAWPYATTFYRDSLAMFLGSLAFFGWVLVDRANDRRQALGGLGLVMLGAIGGVIAKSTMAVLLGALFIGGLASLAASSRQANRRWLMWGGLGAAMLLVAALLVLPGRGPLARLSLSYYAFLARHFWDSFRAGAWVFSAGPFLSPARSIFLFSPPLLLLALLPWTRRRVGWRVALPMVVFSLGVAVAQALFYGDEWAGTFGWGLRFMVPVLPPLFVLASPAVETALARNRRSLRLALGGLLSLSVAVQLGGTAIPWRATFVGWQTAGLDPYTPLAAWQARFLVIPGQIRSLFQPGAWDLAWLRVLRQGEPSAFILPIACLLILGLAVVAWRSLTAGAPGWRIWLAAGALAALGLPVLVTQTALHHDPALAGDVPAYGAWLGWADDHVSADDSVIVDGYASPLWTYMTNTWNLPVRWYSFSYRDPSSGPLGPAQPGDWDTLAEAASRSRHVWLIANVDAPPGSEAAVSADTSLGDPAIVFPGRPSLAVWRLH